MLRIPNAALLDDVPIDEGALEIFVTANEADIRARYEKDYRRLYKKSRRATLSQILLRKDLEGDHPDPRPQLEKILAKARAGENFEDLARTYSEDINARHGGVLGTVAEEQLEKTVAEAVFATGAGGITDILPVKNGLLISKVDAVFPSEETPFDQVKSDIARTLTQERNIRPIAEAFSADILAAWKTDGAAPADKLTAQRLNVQETGSFAVGRPSFPGLSDSPALMSKLTNAPGIGLIDTVFTVPSGHMIVEITQFERPDDTAVQAAKGMTRKRLEVSAKRKFAEAWTKDLVARADVKQYFVP